MEKSKRIEIRDHGRTCMLCASLFEKEALCLQGSLVHHGNSESE